MSNIKIFEVVKNFEFEVDAPSINNKVKAKILKTIEPNTSNEYIWTISHYYKPSKDNAGVYCPSEISGNTLKYVESLLFSYIKNFKDIDIQECKNF